MECAIFRKCSLESRIKTDVVLPNTEFMKHFKIIWQVDTSHVNLRPLPRCINNTCLKSYFLVKLTLVDKDIHTQQGYNSSFFLLLVDSNIVLRKNLNNNHSAFSFLSQRQYDSSTAINPGNSGSQVPSTAECNSAESNVLRRTALNSIPRS